MKNNKFPPTLTDKFPLVCLFAFFFITLWTLINQDNLLAHVGFQLAFFLIGLGLGYYWLIVFNKVIKGYGYLYRARQQGLWINPEKSTLRYKLGAYFLLFMFSFLILGDIYIIFAF